MITTLITFVILLSVLILVHELGHFLAAKRAGVRVEEFGLGLPPRLWGKKIGETIYSINWLPIGGFVKLTGEEGEEGKEGDLSNSQSFANQPNLTKAGIIAAGVMMNFFLGVLLTGVVFAFLGIPKISNVIEIKEVMVQSPAQQAGIKVGDLILEYSSTLVDTSENFVKFVTDNLGKEIILRIERGVGKIKTDITIIPRIDPPENQGPLGIVFVTVPEISYQQIPIYRVPDRAFTEALKITRLMLDGVARVIKDFVIAGRPPQEIAGPVGIARIAGEVAQQGLFPILNFAALLSINLAVINILPFPALDGGRLVFIGLEAILGRKIAPHYQRWAHTIGIAVLLLLMLVITFYDIARWL